MGVRDQASVSSSGLLSVSEVSTVDAPSVSSAGVLSIGTRDAPEVDRTFVSADGALSVGASAPVTVFGPLDFTSGSTAWGGTTVVLHYAAGDLSAAAGDRIRVTTEMDALSAGATMSVAAGRAKTAGDVYDFAVAEAGVLLCNGEAVLTSNGANLINEWIGTLPEDFDNAQPFNIALQFSAAAACTMSRIASATIAGGTYYKSGVAEATLVNKTSYSSWDLTFPHLVSKIEVGFFLT